MSTVIATVEKGSLAKKAGIVPGDEIVLINGIKIRDYLDFMFASCAEEVVLELKDRQVTIQNEDFMPLGIGFSSLLMDEPKACHNRCVFCFIDQLPKNMRPTCYFKDDDYRLSFLQGNYVTMTNMTEEDVDRIIRYHLPRINISVHTTNPALREEMLHNKKAGQVLSYLDRFAQAGMQMNTQIVLCPGINDGKELDRTIADLGAFGCSMESISVVPVGLSDHREGLFPLKAVDEQIAKEVIAQIASWQEKFLEEHGSRMVYLADEFYMLAKEPMPEYDHYEGFPQIENGVGLCASLSEEFHEALCRSKKRKPKRKKTIATGKMAAPLLKSLAKEVGGEIEVIPVENRFFGKEITVAGLVVGKDLIETLKGQDLGEELLIPASMLRHEKSVFLDDTTVEDVERALDIKVTAVPNDGYALLDAILR